MYEMLLPMGDVPMADIVKAAGRHPQIIYRLIEQLDSKGLVHTSIKRHRKYVRAEDPKVFLTAQKNKIDNLESALPALLAIQHKPKEAAVRIERGIEAVRGLRDRAFGKLPPGDTYYILSASGDRFYEVMGDAFFQKVERKREKRKVKKRLLAFESQRSKLEEKERWCKYIEIRYLPEEHSVPTSTNVYNNITAIQVWTPEPIVIVIESKEVAESYKHYFNSLWKVAKR